MRELDEVMRALEAADAGNISINIASYRAAAFLRAHGSDIRELVEALEALHESYVKACPFANVVAQRARAALAKFTTPASEEREDG